MAGKNSLVFLEDLKTSKGHFKINWPLICMYFSCTIIYTQQPIRHVFCMPESFSHHHFKDQRPDVKFFETFQWSCQDGKWRLKWQAHIIMASNCTRAVLCTVQCGVLTFIQKHRKCMAGQDRRKVWKSGGATDFFSWEGKTFATMAARIRKGGGSTSPPVLPTFPTALAWQGGGGVSPLSVRSYGKYAAAGDISEQPLLLSDDVSIYNSQKACLCCHRIFSSLNARFPFFSAWGIGNHQTIGCVITKYKVPLRDVVKVGSLKDIYMVLVVLVRSSNYVANYCLKRFLSL